MSFIHIPFFITKKGLEERGKGMGVEAEGAGVKEIYLGVQRKIGKGEVKVVVLGSGQVGT